MCGVTYVTAYLFKVYYCFSVDDPLPLVFPVVVCIAMASRERSTTCSTTE